MNELEAFAQEVELRVTRARTEPQWGSSDVSRYMTEFCGRRSLFEEKAKHLVATTIRPRLEIVTNCFSNAAIDQENGISILARFGYCERFPVTAKVEFSIDHDVNWSWFHVEYALSIMPTFFKSSTTDRLTLPLEGELPIGNGDKSEAGVGSLGNINQEAGQWVERRLLEFVDSYYQLDRGCEFFDEDTSTDPVCGMRLKRSQAIKHDFRGHQYFFCTPECVATFAATPEKFAAHEVL